MIVDTSLERQAHFCQFQDATDALPCHMRLPVHACESWTLDSRAAKKNTSHGNEVLPQDTTRHLYKDRITNEEVWAKTAKIQQEIGPHEDLTIVKRYKLKWY